MERAPQVITCNEALREVTLFQNVGGKQMSRTFRFDRVGASMHHALAMLQDGTSLLSQKA